MPHRRAGARVATPWTLEALRQGLRDLGYEDGRNVTIEDPWREAVDDGGLMSYGVNQLSLAPSDC